LEMHCTGMPNKVLEEWTWPTEAGPSATPDPRLGGGETWN